MNLNNDEKKNKFICDICKKVLNIQKIIALKKCGHVFCLKCLEDVCKGDENCPSCNTKFISSDKEEPIKFITFLYEAFRGNRSSILTEFNTKFYL